MNLVESTPSQLPSATADGALYLRSQSAPNLRWFRVPKSARPTILNAFDYPQQVALLRESNSVTWEQGHELENGKNKKKTPTKKPQRVAKKEANKEPLICRILREIEILKLVELSPSVAELLKQCKMPSGPPKSLREEYVPLYFRMYGMDHMEREVVKVEDIDKLGAYVFDGPSKRYYHPLVHPILEQEVQQMKNRIKKSVNEQAILSPAKERKKPFSVAFWKKKPRKCTTTIIQRTNKSFEGTRTMPHSSIKPGSSSVSRSIKHYVDAISYAVMSLLKPTHK